MTGEPIVVDPLLSRCAARLLDRVGDLADEMFRAITTEDELYAGMGAEQRADVRDFNERNLREQLTCMAEGRPVSTEMSRVNARRRAAQGVPIAALLHAFRIGYRVMWKALMTEARTWPDASTDEIAHATMTVWALFDACSETVNEVYRETLVDLARADERHRLVLLDALFDGRVADWSMLGGSAEALGLPGRGPYLSVVAGRDEADVLERALARAGLRSAWRPRTDDLAGIVAVPTTADVDRTFATLDENAGRAGISPAYEALGDTAAALRLATLARASLPQDARGATTLDRDPVASLVAAGSELSARLVTTVLGPVLEHNDHKALIESLAAWLDSGSTSDVAARLYCHRNTVRNRLDRVEQLTGRSLNVPADTATLYAAVKALRLSGPS